MTAATTTSPSTTTEPTRVRSMARVESLDSLRGAHPEALRDLFGAGQPLDPQALGEARGALLAVERWTGAFLLTRPLVVGASKLLPWKGKAFESGGTAGANMVFGRRMLRFRCEVEPSSLDGRPALVLRYDHLGNPWPLSGIVDEIRRIGEHVAVGTAALNGRLLFWWGLEL